MGNDSQVTHLPCKSAAPLTRRGMCLIWCLDLQMQGVANPLHPQVKIDTITFPLQVVVATESQLGTPSTCKWNRFFLVF